MGMIGASGGCAPSAPGPLADSRSLPRPEGWPDPLAMADGRPVRSAKDWLTERRPELIRLFQHYMYGYLPPPPARLEATVDRVLPDAQAGQATLKEVTITPGPGSDLRIRLLLVLPRRTPGPVGVLLGLNFCGNHGVIDDPRVAITDRWVPERCPGAKDHRATPEGRGQSATSWAHDAWAWKAALDRGYAVATFYHGDIRPDRPDPAAGTPPEFLKPGQTSPESTDCGTLAAWAWGLQRAVDYLLTDPAIDRRRVAVFGHSRNGKAALLAGALDERIALVIAHQSGCGGAAPSRTHNPKAETLRAINDQFPHWFDAEFKAFSEDPTRLPFDQHELVALCAPRPVLFTNAEEDEWANPAGQFEVLQQADPVYRLLGVRGVDAPELPPPGTLSRGRLGYFIRPGAHSVTLQDWAAFLEFMDVHFRG